jgi:hypothetical protein
MKTFISYLVIAVLVLTSSFTINNQQKLNDKAANGCFNYFRIHRQAKNVAATWSVNTGDVVGFYVERSYDGEFFENAGTLNYNGSSVYKYSDMGVFPGVIYYRIRAVKANGSTEYSDVETIRIVQHG